jgi:hypothetical protein
LIFYSSKEAVIFSEYKVLILSSISSRMAATSLSGASLPSLTRQPSSLHSSAVITTFLVLVGSRARVILNHVYLHLFGKRVFPLRALCTLNWCSSHTYPSSVPYALSFFRCWCHTGGCWNCFSRTTFAAHHFLFLVAVVQILFMGVLVRV